MQDPLQLQKELDSSEKEDISKLDETDYTIETDIEVKSETESAVTEVEAKRKSIDMPSNEATIEDTKSQDPDKEFDSKEHKNINSNSNVDEATLEALRKACNETPTYEAWKTGQVPSPLKRGKSCKTPSPPPCPEKITKASSVPTTARKLSGRRESSNGTTNKNIFKAYLIK